MWVGSQIDYATGSGFLGIVAAFFRLVGSLIVTLIIATRLDHLWRLLRRAADHDQRDGVLGRIFVVAPVVAAVAFTVWFLLLQGPRLLDRRGDAALPRLLPPVRGDAADEISAELSRCATSASGARSAGSTRSTFPAAVGSSRRTPTRWRGDVRAASRAEPLPRSRGRAAARGAGRAPRGRGRAGRGRARRGRLLRGICAALLRAATRRSSPGRAGSRCPAWSRAGGRAAPVPAAPRDPRPTGPETRAVLLTSPSDTTGATFSRRAVRASARACRTARR